MAIGIKDTVANSLINAMLRHTAYTGPASIYIQLHTAAPGAAGTIAIATNSLRKIVAFNAATGTGSLGGISTNTSDISWTSVPATEDYQFFTLWDAISGGNLIAEGSIIANQVASGDPFTISAGTLTASLLTIS